MADNSYTEWDKRREELRWQVNKERMEENWERICEDDMYCGIHYSQR